MYIMYIFMMYMMSRRARNPPAAHELMNGPVCQGPLDSLLENGRLIGANDLWITATALAYGMPVVTKNVEHYRRVPDLNVEEY